MTKPYIYLFTDIESDGPVPGLYSMISFASVARSETGEELGEFEANLEPLPEATQHPENMAWWKTEPEAWKYSTKDPQDPEFTIKEYVDWIEKFDGIPLLAAHPIAFDSMWINWYLWRFVNRKVFTGPGLDIASFAAATFGCKLYDARRDNWPQSWLGGYNHNHTAIDDARGYANAFFEIKKVSDEIKRTMTLKGSSGVVRIKVMAQKHTIPLLKDHHTHISVYGAFANCLNIGEIEQEEQALKAIKNLKEDISVVLGWNSGAFSFNVKELNKMQPLVICNISLHGAIINEPAKEALGDKCPDIIANIENPDWVEKYFSGFLKFLADIKPFNNKHLSDFYKTLEKQGIWYAEDLLVPNAKFLSIIKNSEFFHRTKLWMDLEEFKKLKAVEKSYVYGIKFFTDGALGAKTAAIKDLFLDGQKGFLLYTDKDLISALSEAVHYNKPIAIHAIGDLATEQVVRVIEFLKLDSIKLPEIRMEHCQFIAEEIAKKAKELGIVLSMQPNFSSDSKNYKDRLCKQYLQINNPFRMLIDRAEFIPGKDLIFGSDGMPHGVENALTNALFPVMPGQKLTLEEFVAGYCLPDTSQGEITFEIDTKGKICINNINICD